MFEQIVVEVGALVGFAAFVSVVVNILKYFNVVQDGTADKWVAGFNLVGVLALYIARMLIPDWDPAIIDSALGEIAAVAGYILSFVVMLLGSKLTYTAVRGLPLIGKSHSG